VARMLVLVLPLSLLLPVAMMLVVSPCWYCYT
jgi:hypothetical protein